MPPDARAASVLILLYPHENAWHIPLTLRPSTMALHPGQISLPGGAVEPGELGDEAAVREFHEELGDDGQAIELLGSLSPFFVTASHYLVTPWVGVVGRRPSFVPNREEVEEVLEVPLKHLTDPANFGSETRYYGDQPYLAPHFLFQTHRIWGATCMMLGELVTVIGEARGQGSGVRDSGSGGKQIVPSPSGRGARGEGSQRRLRCKESPPTQQQPSP